VVSERLADLRILGGIEQEPKAFSDKLALRLKNFLSAHLSTSSFMSFNIPLLLTGARGAGKASLIRRVAAELGVHVVEVRSRDFPMSISTSDSSHSPQKVDCYEILDEAPATTEGTLLARLEKAQSCAPCILLLRHVEALGRKEASQKRGKGAFGSLCYAMHLTNGRRLRRLASARQAASGDASQSLGSRFADHVGRYDLGTRSDVGRQYECVQARVEVGCESSLYCVCGLQAADCDTHRQAPNEPERTAILETLVADMNLSVDVDLKRIARETAALTAIDLSNLADRAQMAAMKRLTGLK